LNTLLFYFQASRTKQVIIAAGSLTSPLQARPDVFPRHTTGANEKVDEYVDSLAPQVQPRIATKLEGFQQKTIDSLETQVIEAFRSLFSRNGAAPPRQAKTLDSATPETYGGQSLPFATEIVNLTGSFTKIVDETGDNVRDIFGHTEGDAGFRNTWSLGEGPSDALSTRPWPLLRCRQYRTRPSGPKTRRPEARA
jgi:hypothetical protein